MSRGGSDVVEDEDEDEDDEEDEDEVEDEDEPGRCAYPGRGEPPKSRGGPS